MNSTFIKIMFLIPWPLSALFQDNFLSLTSAKHSHSSIMVIISSCNLSINQISNIPFYVPIPLIFHLTILVHPFLQYINPLETYNTKHVILSLSFPYLHLLFLLIKLRSPGSWGWIEHFCSLASWILSEKRKQNLYSASIYLCLRPHHN